MPQCLKCQHYKRLYLPGLKAYGLMCELPGKREKGCKGDFKRKEEKSNDTERGA